MIFQAYNSNTSTIDVVPFDVFSRGTITCGCVPGRSNFNPRTAMGTICNIRNAKEVLKLPLYRQNINNTDLATNLPDSHIAKGSLFNDNSYGFRGDALGIDDTDINDVQNHRAFLRVNEKTGVVYTVRRSEVLTSRGCVNYYMFRLFQLDVSSKRLILLSSWCVSQIPALRLFDNIIPSVSTFDDVQNIDPNVILFNKGSGQTALTHHAFNDRNGTMIFIDYVKHQNGTFYVSSIQRYENGQNLLPYLLPIDQQLIDPNYEPPSDGLHNCIIS